MNLKEFQIVDKIFRKAVDNMTTDNINGYTKDELFRKWCELEIEITKKEQPVKCTCGKDNCNCPEDDYDCSIPKCEPPIPKCFHIKVDNLHSYEQLKLLSVINEFAVNDLPSNKILIVEIEK